MGSRKAALPHFSNASRLAGEGNFEGAIAESDKALQLDPTFHDVQRLRALALALTERTAEADQALTTERQRRPGDPEVCYHHAEILAQLRRPADMGRAAVEGLQMDPAHPGLIQRRLQHSLMVADYDDAITFALRGVALEPRSPHAHLGLGLIFMLTGSYGLARPHYDGRIPFLHRSPPGERWRGQPTSEPVAIYHEQGLGDTLQTARYFPRLAARAPQAKFVVQPPVAGLLARNFPNLDIIADIGDLFTPAHAWCLDLPAIFDDVLTKVDGSAYLRADPKLRARWQSRLPVDRFTVGLAWSGNRRHARDMYRSRPMVDFLPLAEVAHVSLVSLNVGGAPSDLIPGMLDFSDELTSFEETAALIECLDLVISVDTSVAHLAGALGKENWILLQRPYDWRWGIEGERTNWYSSTTLLRDNTPEAIAARLARRSAARTQH